MKITDLTCNGCGASFEFDQREEYTVREVGRDLVIITENRQPVTLTCSHCGRKAVGEEMEYGQNTRKAIRQAAAMSVNGNGNQTISIQIGGSVIGGEIRIGNNNK